MHLVVTGGAKGNRIGTDALPRSRVLLVGAFDEGLHAHTALRRRALERLGCRVTSFNLMGSGGWLSRLRRIGLQDRLARAVAQTAPEVVLVLEGSQLPATIVAGLRRDTGAAWVNWFCDGRRSPAVVLPVAPAYDLVFVAGSAAVEALRRPGLPPVRYLPPGCDPSVHRPMRSRDQFRANVVFAGTATPHRERMLFELVEHGLAVWGPGWRRTRLRDYCRGEVLGQSDYVRAYAGASVAVNVPCCEDAGAEGEPGCNRRLFELAAIGVPQVVEDRPDLHAHFREGSEVLVARTTAELKTMVREALQDRPWAEQVAAGARQRALREHTYMHRMRALLGAVGERVG
ncbi:MAG TPA: glycosyltransferase [Gemmatimonadales bacterium]|nr:glycosyltransferase [Gemmatimonadales bacterium]